MYFVLYYKYINDYRFVVKIDKIEFLPFFYTPGVNISCMKEEECSACAHMEKNIIHNFIVSKIILIKFQLKFS